MSGFVVASKRMAKAKVAMIGPSGAGKTYSALRMARGLTNNGRVGVLDSENNSASLYSDKFEGWQYMVLPIAPPYTARKYLDAISLAVREGLDCLIIDSLTHAWAGEGGLLQQKEALDSRAGSNSYANWQQITKVHEAMKSQILYSPIHIITTMRSKQEYVLEQNSHGKSVPKKVGLKPIQRDDLEYEFTVVFDIGMDHQFIVSKDRTDLFDGMVAKITEQTGADVRAWLCNDIKTPAVADEVKPSGPVLAQKPPTAPRETVAEPDAMAADEQTSTPMRGPDAYPGGPEPTQLHLSQEELDALKTNRKGTMVVNKIAEAAHQKQLENTRQIKNHADGSVREAPRHAPAAHVDSAEFVIKCGANWGLVGKKVIEVPLKTLHGALTQADGLLAKGSTDKNVTEFVHHARKFLTEMGVAV